ncbi:MAG: ABC transporter ATP-binding protein [Nitriliruptorales bacterium]|nr:ABC transporter ATP-binding protein [Nitriliruptorales bacterium]
MPEDHGDREGAWETIVRGLRLNPELRVGLAGTLALALVATAGRAIVPIAVQQTIDSGLGGAEGGVDLGAILRFVLGAFVAVVITAIASGAMNERLATVVETALSNLRVRAFRHIHDLSMLHQATHQRGQLVARVTTDIDEISRFMSWGGINLITSAGQLTVAAVVMFVYSWQLTLVVLASFVPFAMAARWFQTRLTRTYTIVRQRVGALLAVLAETVVGAPVVRAYGIEERTQRRLDERIEAHRKAAVHAGTLSSSFSGTGEVFAAIGTALAVISGVLLGVDGQVTEGTVVAFLFLITLFVEPVQMATEVINEGQTAVAGWRRVLDILDIPPDVADPEDGREIPPGPIGIRFREVGFRYPRPGESAAESSGPKVLHDIEVDIEPKTRVAIVGETGSGKTTFAKLLTRLMDPTEGAVEVNGVPLDEVAFSSLRDRIVMVPQEGMLFEGTILDNVAMGLTEDLDTFDDRGELLEPVELAFLELGLADWLDELPDHLETEVGARGTALSAGERQLVALARAYVANPDLLVLDEATSAVDPATEVRLQRALVGLTRGRTTVSIAHRLSTAESAELVLVFDEGRIVERGVHEDLVERGGVYSRLHESWRTGQAAA